MNEEEQDTKKITLPYRLVYLTKLYDDPTDLDDDPLATLGGSQI